MRYKWAHYKLVHHLEPLQEELEMHSVTDNIPLSTSSIGTRRYITVHRFGVGHPGPKIYFQGGLHASELPGMVILAHLVRLLQGRDDEPNGEIIIVPCANPIGLSQRMQGLHVGRSDLGVGGNFNRNFPDLSALLVEQFSALRCEERVLDEAAVKLELRKAVAAIVPKNELDSMKQVLLGLAIDADYVLDLHSDDLGVVYAYVSNPEHPAADLMCSHTKSVVSIDGIPDVVDFPAACLQPWRTARKLLPDVPITECLTATLEYRGVRDVRDDVAIDDARGLLGFMEAVGILQPEGAPQPQPATLHTTQECVDYVRANAPGISIFSKGPGDHVTAGEEVALILDPTTGERTSLKARSSGIVFGCGGSKVVVPGSVIATIAGNSPLAMEAGDPFP
ncbi:succinylglutamate desuccinylase/aspartoacylase family protein [Mesorhizobium sp.]|uniref:M14 family zinc carboxypeptidase n=1 Tax=Mesorhizobium sp. TaxID=1871066 RepID=UPI0025CC19CD|nr:succinylglutamate desuccinylase/aspartoacylase family protein [Mesorhizobium sp.]